jgi:hypothetical protein
LRVGSADHRPAQAFEMSNGIQKGPPIGVEEGPPFRI